MLNNKKVMTFILAFLLAISAHARGLHFTRALGSAQISPAKQLRSVSASAYKHQKLHTNPKPLHSDQLLPFKDRDDTRCFWSENDKRISKVGFMPFGASLPVENLGDLPVEQLQVQMQFYLQGTRQTYEVQDLDVQEYDHFFEVWSGLKVWPVVARQDILKSDGTWLGIDEIVPGDEIIDAFGELHMVDEVTRVNEPCSVLMLQVIELNKVPIYQPVINKIIEKHHNYLKKQSQKEPEKKHKGKKKPVAEKKVTKQRRLLGLLDDDRQPSYIRGHIQNDLYEIASGIRKNIRVPKGYSLAHYHGCEAAKGYNYLYTALQMDALHIVQHKHDGGGRKNKEGKINFSKNKFFHKATWHQPDTHE